MAKPFFSIAEITVLNMFLCLCIEGSRVMILVQRTGGGICQEFGARYIIPRENQAGQCFF